LICNAGAIWLTMETISMKRPHDQEKWKNHVESYKNGGLSKTNYCKIHKIGYHQFSYWIKKFKANPPLIPIRIKAPIEVEPAVLCTLQFKQGAWLKIYDLKTLGTILGMLGACHAV